ncbi:MAG: DUF2064 domain-containing protein [Candidatus Falkowbacteria bacterium]|nr:DUF2064 domain-containing protein [Candidatus Falkowbacteria bacterium]
MTFNKKKDNLIIIFAKKPELGMVKTRIARETSDKFALDFSRACFSDLLNKIGKSDYYDLLVGVDDLDSLSWYQKNYSLEGFVINSGGIQEKIAKQSQKLEFIFSELLNHYKYKRVIVIPMDIPFILEEDIITAFARLEEKTVVLGPEINGGIYLIGLSGQYKQGIFNEVRWSTQNSFSDLSDNIARIVGIDEIFSLKLKNDLNMPEDLLTLREDIRHDCPLLFNFLKENGYYQTFENKFINYDELSISIPLSSCIIKKNEAGTNYIFIQDRYKPIADPANTNKIEIPATLIKKFQLPQDAIRRDVLEESGLNIEIENPDESILQTGEDGELVSRYPVFSCVQQLMGGRSYLQLVFQACYKSGEFSEKLRKSRNPRWIPETDLERMVSDSPESFSPLTLMALLCYYNGHQRK